MGVRPLKIATPADAESALRAIGLNPAGMADVLPGMFSLTLRVSSLPGETAELLRHRICALGGNLVRGEPGNASEVDLLLMGTRSQLGQTAEQMTKESPALSAALKTALDHTAERNFGIRFQGRRLDLGERTCIMGVLNVTPDSFSDGNSYRDPEKALDRALEMVDEGADIIDVGGESTRPGARGVSLEEEFSRVIPVVERLAVKIDRPISIDTWKADVARRAIGAGAWMVNDISGLRFDGAMAGVVAESGCPVVVMHIKGKPADMQTAPVYDCVLTEVIDALKGSIDIAEKAGIAPEKMIVDPGIGFGKRLDDNLNLIHHLDELKILGKAVLVGLSRKSFVGALLGESDPLKRLEGTLAATVLAVAGGAHIVRVHDVKETREALTVADAILRCR